MLVANVETNLIPAQVLRIEDVNNSVEETRYFLPIGKELDVSLIIEFLKAQNIAFDLDSQGSESAE
jgi:hypothetical protein